MLQRLIENWLDKSTERSFQTPFCCMLAAQGYTVVHLSRHCGMELGKDVLAIAPDGTPCAYQLKKAEGGRVSQRQWQQDISPQVVDLVCGRIVHPSVAGGQAHRAYLVTNGVLAEEVSRAIDDMNRRWAETGQAAFRLQTIVRGELLQLANHLGTGGIVKSCG